MYGRRRFRPDWMPYWADAMPEERQERTFADLLIEHEMVGDILKRRKEEEDKKKPKPNRPWHKNFTVAQMVSIVFVTSFFIAPIVGTAYIKLLMYLFNK